MRETNYRAHGEHRVKRKDRMNRIKLNTEYTENTESNSCLSEASDKVIILM